jgi:hypothetical protein
LYWEQLHTQRLLLEEQEDGVKELEVLGEVVELLQLSVGSACRNLLETYVVQDDKGLSPSTLGIADSMEDTATDNGGKKLLNEESQESTADQSQVEIVNEEETLELEGLTVAHPFATTEDDGVVDNNEDRCRLESGHGGLERHKLEVIGGVANNSSECLVKDGPQVNAKRPVDGWQRKLLVESSGRRRHDGRIVR